MFSTLLLRFFLVIIIVFFFFFFFSNLRINFSSDPAPPSFLFFLNLCSRSFVIKTASSIRNGRQAPWLIHPIYSSKFRSSGLLNFDCFSKLCYSFKSAAGRLKLKNFIKSVRANSVHAVQFVRRGRKGRGGQIWKKKIEQEKEWNWNGQKFDIAVPAGSIISLSVQFPPSSRFINNIIVIIIMEMASVLNWFERAVSSFSSFAIGYCSSTSQGGSPPFHITYQGNSRNIGRGEVPAGLRSSWNIRDRRKKKQTNKKQTELTHTHTHTKRIIIEKSMNGCYGREIMGIEGSGILGSALSVTR